MDDQDNKPDTPPTPRRGRPAAFRLPTERQARAAEALPPPDKRLSIDQYNALWLAYTEQQDVVACAKKVDIPVALAHDYIFGKGDPANALEPIHERWVRSMRLTHAVEDWTLSRFRAQVFKDVVQEQMTIIRGDTILHKRELARRMEAAARGQRGIPMMALDKLIASAERLFRIGSHCLGETEQKQKAQDDPFVGWSEAEIMAFWTTGQRPNRTAPAITIDVEPPALALGTGHFDALRSTIDPLPSEATLDALGAAAREAPIDINVADEEAPWTASEDATHAPEEGEDA